MFASHEIEQIKQRFGEDFYEKAVGDIDVYAGKWALSSFELIPSYSANLAIKCVSAPFGDAVLKIGNPASRETAAEFHALREYGGGRFCKGFAADPDNGVMLLEQIRPGKSLRAEPSLHKRLSVFCSLYQGLHLAPTNAALFPTYTEWVNRITEYMSKRHDCRELYLYMKKAKEVYDAVSGVYSQNMLLHGDFHHDNMLLGPGGEYVLIDPKGVVGDPVFDVPRFMLNEFDDELTADSRRKINEVIGFLEERLQIPNDILRKCLFVETAMAVCWHVEDGATPEQFSELAAKAAFSDSLLNGK